MARATGLARGCSKYGVTGNKHLTAVNKQHNDKATTTMAARDLTEDEVADLKEAFAMFDINGDGRFRKKIYIFVALEPSFHRGRTQSRIPGRTLAQQTAEEMVSPSEVDRNSTA